MAKFNVTKTRAAGVSPLVSTGAAANHEGAAGYARDAKSELFLLAVANMAGEGTFYETAGERDSRYAELVRAVAVADAQWTAGLLGWLRTGANMRSASLVGAAEAVKARLGAGGDVRVPVAGGAFTAKVGDPPQQGRAQETVTSRQIIASVLQRADEPGELLAYWTSRYGRTIPKPVKRGVADAVGRLYNEYGLLKYDTDSKGFRFGDVIDLVHPTAVAPWQGTLFEYALDRRHGRGGETTGLPMVDAQMLLRSRVLGGEPELLLDPAALKAAGMTWEDALSMAGNRVDKAQLWSALIPTMGYMALLRNLRNFDEAGVSDEQAEQVSARLADPEQVAKSKQFPFRFYAAHNAVGSLRWAHTLEKALRASLANVPALPGRTLVLVDQSPSMWPGYGMKQQHRDIINADLARLFGSAVALRAADATLVGYGGSSTVVPFRKGDAVLSVMGRFQQINATDTFGAIGRHYQGHDRVVIVTDEQNQPGQYRTIDDVLPQSVPAYVWNIGGYAIGATASGVGRRHTFAGLNDAAFRMVPMLEAHGRGVWPWAAED